MKTFNEFINESYMVYSDYVNLHDKGVIPFIVGKDNMMNYSKQKIMDLLPMVGALLHYNKLVKNLEDQSVDDKGIKFEGTLYNGVKFQMLKLPETKSFKSWEFYYERKRVSEDSMKKILNDLLSKFEEESTELMKYKELMNKFDMHQMYSDDRQKFLEYHSQKNILIDKYSKLTKKEKYSAWEFAKNKFHNFKEYKNFWSFKGA